VGAVIFSRGRGSGRHVRGEDTRGGRARHAAEPRGDGAYNTDGSTDDEGAGPLEVGPYDVADEPPGVERLDLGSLRIPAIEGVEVRVQADPDGQVQQVVLVYGESALQLGVFAAPRSEGIWDEVRAEIRKSLYDDGVAAEEIDGEYGVELRARVRTPDGLTDLRFLGVDGPRWMVRGVYQGKAAIDPAAAGALLECLHGLVVDRGKEAKPAREPLPLRLPREVAEQANQAREQDAQPADASDATAPGGQPGAINGAGPSGKQPPGPDRRPSPRPRRQG
jgi:hypothetical protein